MPAKSARRLKSALAHMNRWHVSVISAGLATATFAATVIALSAAVGSPVNFDAAVVLDAPPVDSADAAPAVIDKDGWLVIRPVATSAFGRTSAPAQDQAKTHSSVPDTADRLASSVLPFNRKDDRARLVVIVTGIGMIRAASEAAIDALPAAVTLALDPYAVHPADWARIARRAGHEIIVGVPLEESQSHADDAGLQAPRSAEAAPENIASLTAMLDAVPGTIGIIATGGGAFRQNPEVLQPAAEVLHARRMLLVDATEKPHLFARAWDTAQLGRVAVDVTLDDPPSPLAIDRKLASLTELASERFLAVAAVHAYPVTLLRLQTWVASLDDARFVLAPVSAVAGLNAGTP